MTSDLIKETLSSNSLLSPIHIFIVKDLI